MDGNISCYDMPCLVAWTHAMHASHFAAKIRWFHVFVISQPNELSFLVLASPKKVCFMFVLVPYLWLGVQRFPNPSGSCSNIYFSSVFDYQRAHWNSFEEDLLVSSPTCVCCPILTLSNLDPPPEFGHTTAEHGWVFGSPLARCPMCKVYSTTCRDMVVGLLF